jgi:general L-amino acid transport system permease protein
MGNARQHWLIKLFQGTRSRFFGTGRDACITLVMGFLLIQVLGPLGDWLIWEATFFGSGREACQGREGACWVFITTRIGQFLFGFYPAEQRWRGVIAVALLVASLVPIFKKDVKFRAWWLLSGLALTPTLVSILLLGGVLGLEPVETDRWGGLMLTVILSYAGILLSLPLGIVLALGRRSQLPVVSSLSVAFIELWRGVPLITVLFMASVMLPLFMPEGASIDKLLRALIGLALFASAYMAEVIRGGLAAIPKGQYEAAMALGLSLPEAMALVILPQALRKVIPGIVNTFIGLFKDTSLVLVIGMFDLIGMVQSAISDPEWLGMAGEGYVFAGLIYWLCCYAMSRYSARLERGMVRD